jgi:hypothetical protein
MNLPSRNHQPFALVKRVLLSSHGKERDLALQDFEPLLDLVVVKVNRVASGMGHSSFDPSLDQFARNALILVHRPLS